MSIYSVNILSVGLPVMLQKALLLMDVVMLVLYINYQLYRVGFHLTHENQYRNIVLLTTVLSPYPCTKPLWRRVAGGGSVCLKVSHWIYT